MKIHPFLAVCFCLALAAALPAQSVPATLNYQGRLTDNGSTPAPITATVNMQFAIYDAATAGAVLWQEPAGAATMPVSVTGGIFSVVLGANGVAVPASLFTGGTTRWLQITANGETLAPRQKLAANGWANQAQNAALAVNSNLLGGTAAAGYQLATVQSCPAGQFVSAISNGAASCTATSGSLNPPVTIAASLAGTALDVTNNGGGMAGYFTNNSAAGSAPALSAFTNTPSGATASFTNYYSTATGNGVATVVNGSGSALFAQATGTGSAGTFTITNAASAAHALEVQSAGSGQTIYSINSGSGRSGEFRNSNAGNSSDVISVYSLGTGDAVNGYAQGTGGRAGYFSAGNASNASPAIYASSAGGEGISASSIKADSVGVHGSATTASGGFGVRPIGVLGDGGAGGYGVQGNGSIGVFGNNSGSGYGLYGYSSAGNGAYLSSGSGTTLFLGNGSNVATVSLIVGSVPGFGNVFRLDAQGKVFANGGYQTGGADVAEFIASDDALEAGDVVEIDPDHDGRFRKARAARSSAVAGVITTQPGLTMNADDAAGGTMTGPALALAGRVPVKVTAENGPIHRGDLLVTSSTPGRAMKTPPHPEPGTIIGKALGELKTATGIIEMLVMLR